MSKKSLLIGINYTGTNNQLEGCINDVQHVRSFLLEKCGWTDSNIELLTDQTPVKPTRANIESRLQSLVQTAQPGDTLVFHYSGHGSRVRDRTRDESDGWDEVIVPLDFNSAGMIADDWLWQNVLTKVPSQVTLWVFMDCCHAGTILDLRHNYRSLCRLKQGRIAPGPYVPEQWTDQFTYSLERSREIPNAEARVVMFSGSLDPEYAADAYINAKAQGAFTFALLKTLENVVQTDTQWPLDRLKLRNALKEINCRLDLSRFLRQQCQLSLSRPDLFEAFLNL
jgi:hypothetical protein